jgi:hypothetical protein
MQTLQWRGCGLNAGPGVISTPAQLGQDFVVADGGLLEESEQDLMLVPLLGGGHHCGGHTPLFAGDIGTALHAEARAGRDCLSQRTQVGPVAMQLTVVSAQEVSRKRETREPEAPQSLG